MEHALYKCGMRRARPTWPFCSIARTAAEAKRGTEEEILASLEYDGRRMRTVDKLFDAIDRLGYVNIPFHMMANSLGTNRISAARPEEACGWSISRGHQARPTIELKSCLKTSTVITDAAAILRAGSSASSRIIREFAACTPLKRTTARSSMAMELLGGPSPSAAGKLLR